MRTTLIRAATCVTLAIAGAAIASAQTPQAKPDAAPDRAGTAAPPGAVAKPAPSQSASADLSQAECTGLGGKVVTTFPIACASGSACYTTDKNGVVHHACINEKDKQ
jgi:hypothetical protein